MFKIGDKVSLNKGITIGTVIRLTDKKQDVVVDFGNFCQKFSQTGRSIGGDIWNFDYIYPLTDELKRKGYLSFSVADTKRDIKRIHCNKRSIVKRDNQGGRK